MFIALPKEEWLLFSNTVTNTDPTVDSRMLDAALDMQEELDQKSPKMAITCTLP